MNNFDPDLRAFKARGGKLIHYHGWSDAQPSPANSVDYFGRVQKAVGGDSSDFYRLFMVPGMGHCGGGPGTDQFDKIGTIRAWVEEGKAPAPDPGGAQDRREDGSQPAAVPASADREIQRLRQHRRRRELQLRGALTQVCRRRGVDRCAALRARS